MNKLWILRPVAVLSKDDNPWEPWYDKVFGFVVSAETEQDARKIADSSAGDENPRGTISKTSHPWLDPKYSTCDELTPGGRSGVIIRDFLAA